MFCEIVSGRIYCPLRAITGLSNSGSNADGVVHSVVWMPAGEPLDHEYVV